MFRRTATVFRVVAVAEAWSWVALLVGMFAKYVLDWGEGGVPVVGMIHGVVFVVYCSTAIATAVILKWDWRTAVLALAAGVPPLLTWAFEVWALRSGKFDSHEVLQAGGMGLMADPDRRQRV